MNTGKSAARRRLMLGMAVMLAAAPTAQALGQAQKADRAVAGRAAAAGLKKVIKQTSDRLEATKADPAVRGSGPFPASMEVDLALPAATIYRPADLDRLGRRRLGVLIWGNGGCSNDGASAYKLLAEIASHGYLVIAPGKPITGPITAPGMPAGQPLTTSIQDLRGLLEWALAENGRSGSPYYRRIDPAAIAVSGHSCGGMQAMLLADDPRVKTAIVHNSGIFPNLPANPPLVMHTERARGITRPVLFISGRADDVAADFAAAAFAGLGQVPAVIATTDEGHDGKLDEPYGGPSGKLTVAWLEWQLRGDRTAGATFTGSQCGLCKDPAWSVRKKNMP